MALRLGCMMLITFRNSKERGFDPHPCQHVFALVQVVFLFAIAFSRVASHLGTVGAKATRGWAEAYPKLISEFLPCS
jgi:hypothetical protein